MSRRFLDDRRGVSTVVSHTLAIGITSILILGLLFAANTYLADQETLVTEDSLETVGNRLASELSQLDRLSTRRANVTMWATHQERIAGASYDVRIDHGPECDTNTITAETCLVVYSAELDVERRVPIQNDSDLAINQTSPGRFQLVALDTGTRSGRSSLAGTSDLVESNMRVGIGEDVKRDNIGEARELQNIPPTNLSIRIDRRTSSEYPQNGEPIDFVVEADDADGKIDTYSIEWGDGSAQFSRDPDPNVTDLKDGTPTHQYASAGVYGLTFTATDDDGESATITEPINISGLHLNSLTRVGSPSGYAITLDVTNTHDRAVDVESLFLNPSDDDTDRIDNDAGPELAIDTDDDGDYERAYSADDLPQRNDIPETGLFTGTSLDDGDDPDDLPTIPANADAKIAFRGVESGGDDTYDIGVNYLLDERIVTSKFTDVGPDAGPTVSITGYSPSNPEPSDTIQFTASASDPDGSITNYEWNFGDGDTASGPSRTNPSHTYSSPGWYTVTLTVTDDAGATYTTTETIRVAPDANEVVQLDGSPDAGYGWLQFDLENTGSVTVSVEDVTVDVTSSSDATEVEWGAWREIEFDEGWRTIGHYSDDFDLGTRVELDDAAQIDGGHETEVTVAYVRDDDGDRVHMDDETIEFTVYFSDGTQETYTLDT
ncbi:PKD domain-containing protein [Halorientalis brevis]|uniref:PKD domain-containing protein n=1 Tax=Halorientalis brevis TaxID=1126241 RepID=A0ABD6CBT2_9EURY|nr:PKD domain-containing protein [Halorientalis brevis]